MRLSPGVTIVRPAGTGCIALKSLSDLILLFAQVTFEGVSLLAQAFAFGARIIAPVFGKEAYGSAARVRGWFMSPFFGGAKLSIGARLEFEGFARIRLGNRITLFGNSYLNANGSSGRIEMGDGTHVDHFCVLYGQGGLKIGSKCAIASGVTIYTQTNQYALQPELEIIEQPVVYGPVEVGNDVWIGTRAVILPGLKIGDHAVIAAGAVVTSDVEPWTIAAGVPARAIGSRAANKKLVSG